MDDSYLNASTSASLHSNYSKINACCREINDACLKIFCSLHNPPTLSFKIDGAVTFSTVSYTLKTNIEIQ